VRHYTNPLPYLHIYSTVYQVPRVVGLVDTQNVAKAVYHSCFHNKHIALVTEGFSSVTSHWHAAAGLLQ